MNEPRLYCHSRSEIVLAFLAVSLLGIFAGVLALIGTDVITYPHPDLLPQRERETDTKNGFSCRKRQFHPEVLPSPSGSPLRG